MLAMIGIPAYKQIFSGFIGTELKLTIPTQVSLLLPPKEDA